MKNPPQLKKKKYPYQKRLNFFITDHIGVGLFRYNLKKSKMELFNRGLVKILGYQRKEELAGRDLKSLFRKTKEAEVFINKVIKEKKINFYETQFKNKQGFLWVGITAILVRDKNKLYIEGMVEDISLHRKYEEELDFQRSLFESVLDNIPDAVYFKDKKNRLVRVNKFYAQGFKMSKEELIGKTDFDFFPYEQARQMFEDDNFVLTTGRPIVGKIEKTLLPDGTWNRVVTTKIPLYNRKGKIIGTMGITRDITRFSNIEEEKIEIVTKAIMALAKALEMKDPYTFGHANRVSLIVEKIAQELKWSEEEILGIKMAAQLHDLGKIAIPSEILAKPGELSELEYRVVQEHVQKCYDIIKDIRYPFPLAETIYQHHERLDGSGYPQGLLQKKIIPEARILAVSDVLEAMTFHRPYREALGIEKALEELQRGANKKYDRKIVDIVLRLIRRNKGRPFWLTFSN